MEARTDRRGGIEKKEESGGKQQRRGKKRGENEFAIQRAGIQSNNYSTASSCCASREAEFSHSQFQFIFIEAIVSILAGWEEREGGRRELGQEAGFLFFNIIVF